MSRNPQRPMTFEEAQRFLRGWDKEFVQRVLDEPILFLRGFQLIVNWKRLAELKREYLFVNLGKP